MRFLLVNKKRMGIVLVTLIVTISLIKYNLNSSSIETMIWSVENKTIILDPGHGYPDERCVQRKWCNREQY